MNAAPFTHLTSALAIAALACSGQQQAPAEPTEPPAAAAPSAEPEAKAPEPAAEAAKPAAEVSDKAEDPSFEMQLSPVGTYAAGKLGTAQLSLKPRGEYHINQEYPISIDLKGSDGMTLPKQTLGKDEAASFGDKEAKFDVPFSCEKAGEHRIEALVKFAVCTPETCVPDERTLALNVAVD
ncbi:MAG: hypothetical protein OEZ06_05845 [Myxococcales bacterium]|nr:hypothetical protein [Myxococcales bacterium]